MSYLPVSVFLVSTQVSAVYEVVGSVDDYISRLVPKLAGRDLHLHSVTPATLLLGHVLNDTVVTFVAGTCRSKAVSSTAILGQPLGWRSGKGTFARVTSVDLGATSACIVDDVVTALLGWLRDTRATALVRGIGHLAAAGCLAGATASLTDTFFESDIGAPAGLAAIWSCLEGREVWTRSGRRRFEHASLSASLVRLLCDLSLGGHLGVNRGRSLSSIRQ